MRSLILICLSVLAAGCAAWSTTTPRESLDQAPQWQPGEWWTLHVTAACGGETNITRVVTGTIGPDYLVGMPSDDFRDSILSLHIPGFGDVSRANLSYQIHNVPFQLVRFPIVDGDTWETNFEGGHVNVTLAKRSDTLVDAIITGDYSGSATYDASVHEFTKLDFPGYADITLVDHGYAYKGLVTVPHRETLVFSVGRSVVPRTTNITDTVDVRGSFTHASFVVAATSIGQAPAGAYRARVTDPSGETFDFSTTPGDSPGCHQQAFRSANPVGTWTFDNFAGGPGFVLEEGLAYESREVRLAD
jgi:hypothetical protein